MHRNCNQENVDPADLYLVFVCGEVQLAADEDEDGLVRLDVPLRLHHPDGDVLVAVAVANVVDEQGAHGVAVVGFRYRSEKRQSMQCYARNISLNRLGAQSHRYNIMRKQ